MSAVPNGAAVFLDRDGTIIRDVHYLNCESQIELLPGAAAAIAQLRNAGFKIVVITNQSAVARGLLTEADLARIHRTLEARLSAAGASVDAIYYCPHHPTAGDSRFTMACNCRKPKTGMAERACHDLQIDPRVSFMVGDQPSDMEMAANIGAQGVLIASEAASPSTPTEAMFHRVGALSEASQWILDQISHGKGERV